VRLAALDALKKVNPALHGPVATLVTPLGEDDFAGSGTTRWVCPGRSFRPGTNWGKPNADEGRNGVSPITGARSLP
jgi:hypothetical protein